MSFEWKPSMISNSNYIINGNYYYHVNFILFVLHYGKEVELAVKFVMSGLDVLKVPFHIQYFFFIGILGFLMILIYVTESIAFNTAFWIINNLIRFNRNQLLLERCGTLPSHLVVLN